MDARLRDVTSGSARALLLVVLGEFVLPVDEPVRSTPLIGALTDLGFGVGAARKALQRTAERGVVRAHRDGRQMTYQLTATGRALLVAGGERVYGFTGTGPDWDGRWLVVSVSVPEAQRPLRHQLRTRFTWAGLGSPAPGLWVTPHADRADVVAGIMGELGLDESAYSTIGPFGPVGDEAEMVARAWDLDGLEAGYRAFLDRYTGRRPRTDLEAFRAHLDLVQSWRRFPYLDPTLPPALAGPHPLARRATRAFGQHYAAWQPRSLRHWERRLTDG